MFFMFIALILLEELLKLKGNLASFLLWMHSVCKCSAVIKKAWAVIWLPQLRARGNVVCKPVYLSLRFFSHFLVFSSFYGFFPFISGSGAHPGGYLDSREPIFLICGLCFEWRHSITKRRFSLNIYETWLFLYYKVMFKVHS